MSKGLCIFDLLYLTEFFSQSSGSFFFKNIYRKKFSIFEELFSRKLKLITFQIYILLVE